MSEDPTAQTDASVDEFVDPFVVTPALRRRLQSCFERAIKLTEQDGYDHDYVHTMLAECVAKDPSNLVYVESLLDNLAEKYGNNKRGARLKGFGGRGPLKKAITREDWQEILKIGPDLLKTNPWDIQILRAMANACSAYHYNEVELRYLKNALEGKPKDPDVNRHCARSLERMGIFSQAIVCWHRVEEACPKDPEPPRMISDLTVRQRSGPHPEEANRTRVPRTPGGSKTVPPASAEPQDEEPPPSFAPAEPANKKRSVELTRRQELEQLLIDNPSDLDAYVELSQIHLNEGRPRDAESALSKALQASGNDPRIREKLEDASIAISEQQVQVAEQRLQTRQSAESQELVQQLKADLYRLELEIYNSRAQRYPENQQLKYELGVRLKRLGNYEQAIEQLSLAKTEASLACLATIEIGECLQHLKQYGKALRRYLAAAEHAEKGPDKKLALYRAGVLATGLREFELARKSLSELVELDAEYKDAGARLDKLAAISDKE